MICTLCRGAKEIKGFGNMRARCYLCEGVGMIDDVQAPFDDLADDEVIVKATPSISPFKTPGRKPRSKNWG